MEFVGVRELKNHLTRYLRSVQKGEKVIVTDRGNPVAILRSLDEMEVDASPEERMVVLAKKGLIQLPPKGGKVDQSSRAVPVKGKPLSRIVIEERR
ncbi:MAG: type II toxin-antitoxin system prevent-host-death family antitoxin [Candidatus Manganitrophaceae bacterium]